MAQQVKDPVWSLLWFKFSPWPGNVHIPQARPKKKKKKKNQKKAQTIEVFPKHLVVLWGGAGKAVRDAGVVTVMVQFHPRTKKLPHSTSQKKKKKKKKKAKKYAAH